MAETNETNKTNNNQVDTNNSSGTKKNNSFLLKFLLIQLIVIVVVGFTTWHFAVISTIKYIQNILNFSRQTVKEYIFSEFGKTSTEKKLIVLTQDVSVEISRDKDKRILDDWLSIGSANLKIKFIDNKVQYFVPLDEIKDSNFIYDAESRTMKIECPSVRLDKEMVFIQSDPNKVIKEENGSLNPFGPKLKDLDKEIMSEIKNRILIEGNKPLIREKAQIEARIALENLFNKVLGEFLRKEDVKLQLIYP